MDKNICRAAWGPGPEDKRCKDCIHFTAIVYNRQYFKCDLRKMTHGKATDHSGHWQTCAKFEAGAKKVIFAPK